MKLVYVSFVVAMVTAISTVGCGRNNETPVPANAVTTAAVAPIPAPGSVGTIPTGCYHNGATACAPCPTGYVQNGSFCSLTAGVGATGCSGGAWNGYACQPNGFNCPASTAWSWQQSGCISSNQQNFPGYQCVPYGYAYVCYYTYGAPSNGYYYNGYGWFRF